jgi:CheY-like chemotaxis protein
MPRTVLIVESSLAVRGVAESLLRQNGYAVVAADQAAAAWDILRTSKIDLLLISSDVIDGTGKRFYEAVGDNTATAVLPLLILHDPTGGPEPAYPPEAIITKPFTPRSFLDAVATFAAGASRPMIVNQSPFADAEFEDTLIDSALGLDKIEVDDTEVLDEESGTPRKGIRRQAVESMIGFDLKVNGDDSGKLLTPKIDAVNVPAETARPLQETPARPDQGKPGEFLGIDHRTQPKKPAPLSESSKIEIVTDQYGMISPATSHRPEEPEDGTQSHDYDWFVKELQKETSGDLTPPSMRDSGRLTIAPTADMLSPRVPPPPSEIPSKPAPAEPPRPAASVGVNQFISEFKKEMERFTADSSSPVPVTTVAASGPSRPAGGPLNWDEALEQASPGEIRLFSEELARAAAAQVAAQIIATLDPDVLYRLIKDALDAALRDFAKRRKP